MLTERQFLNLAQSLQNEIDLVKHETPFALANANRSLPSADGANDNELMNAAESAFWAEFTLELLAEDCGDLWHLPDATANWIRSQREERPIAQF